MVRSATGNSKHWFNALPTAVDRRRICSSPARDASLACAGKAGLAGLAQLLHLLRDRRLVNESRSSNDPMSSWTGRGKVLKLDQSGDSKSPNMLVVLPSGGVFIHERQDGDLSLARLGKHDSPRLELILFVELGGFREQVARAARQRRSLSKGLANCRSRKRHQANSNSPFLRDASTLKESALIASSSALCLIEPASHEASVSQMICGLVGECRAAYIARPSAACRKCPLNNRCQPISACEPGPIAGPLASGRALAQAITSPMRSDASRNRPFAMSELARSNKGSGTNRPSYIPPLAFRTPQDRSSRASACSINPNRRITSARACSRTGSSGFQVADAPKSRRPFWRHLWSNKTAQHLQRREIAARSIHLLIGSRRARDAGVHCHVGIKPFRRIERQARHDKFFNRRRSRALTVQSLCEWCHAQFVAEQRLAHILDIGMFPCQELVEGTPRE